MKDVEKYGMASETLEYEMRLYKLSRLVRRHGCVGDSLWNRLDSCVLA